MTTRNPIALLLSVALWLQLVWAGLKGPTTVKGKPFPSLIDATMVDIAKGLDTKLFTSVDLTKAYMARINEVNDYFHAVTEMNPDALKIAAEMDEERARGKTRGPLHGIPVLLKMSMASADAMNTTGGSTLLLGAKFARDATVVRKVREAGGVILGKANMSQWATFRSSDNSSSNGWSAHGGQCLGAYHDDMDPSGSSSGSAVATTLGLAAAALGTETDGSVILPAQTASLVGIKPSVGLTSRFLVLPVSEHQDTVGTIARTVKDAARLLQPIVGRDDRDNYTDAIPFEQVATPDYERATQSQDALRGARLGVPTNTIALFRHRLPDEDPVMQAFRAAVDEVKRAGAVVVEANFTMAEQWNQSKAENIVLFSDMVTALPRFLAELTVNPSGIRNLADVRRLTIKAGAREDYPARDVETWDVCLDEQGFGNDDPRALAALAEDRMLGGQGGLLGAIERHRLDAVLMPTPISRNFAAIVGAPVVTVPMGYYPASHPVKKVPGRVGLVDQGPNIPFGLSFLGARFTEEKLIALAYGYEQRTNFRDKVPPIRIPKTELGDIVGF
ncbi:hypothetical protein MCOR27_000105 [Pyricularia oryzae]|uniref:Amidase domain-containing protein n=1 Tax=Pyricularia grisea TaxID=148305 RepID=A0ABQ8NW01_PYRGI|nr:hypothetical protein MCOR01_006794 [Pyricularia oryzae]KAI6302937.1 hypothetical protein MCOR33_001847 [Pyricularia grisea]KAI6287323.1 hypothetical protein MCOR26_000575 [Pyricularia oryzae]KAI6289609.1 hypothetical protein MCOR27_000105 [Pyricularia oryzae]KAI6327789.1 hypothetical protein MCOR29_002815 [Pyricularia oryzae]